MAECFLIRSQTDEAGSITYTPSTTSVAKGGYIFNINLPEYMSTDGSACEVLMKCSVNDTALTDAQKAGFAMVAFDEDAEDDNYFCGVSVIGYNVKYAGRRISYGWRINTSTVDYSNYYHFTIRRIFGHLYVEGTSSSYYYSSSKYVNATSSYVVRYINSAGTTMQIISTVLLDDISKSEMTITRIK